MNARDGGRRDLPLSPRSKSRPGATGIGNRSIHGSSPGPIGAEVARNRPRTAPRSLSRGSASGETGIRGLPGASWRRGHVANRKSGASDRPRMPATDRRKAVRKLHAVPPGFTRKPCLRPMLPPRLDAVCLAKAAFFPQATHKSLCVLINPCRGGVRHRSRHGYCGPPRRRRSGKAGRCRADCWKGSAAARR